MNLLVSDNLEIACQAIERAAMDQAVIDVDENFANSYEARRRHREVIHSSCRSTARTELVPKMRPGQAFWDSSAPPSTFSMSLPDPLRIKPSGVQVHQFSVYEDFGTFSLFDQPFALLIFAQAQRGGPLVVDLDQQWHLQHQTSTLLPLLPIQWSAI